MHGKIVGIRQSGLSPAHMTFEEPSGETREFTVSNAPLDVTALQVLIGKPIEVGRRTLFMGGVPFATVYEGNVVLMQYWATVVAEQTPKLRFEEA